MPDLLREKNVTARKPHRCSTCGAVCVQPGEQYHRATYAYDGRVYDWINCADCSALAGDVYDWAGGPDDGVSGDDFQLWAEENTADPRAVAFLRRLGYGDENLTELIEARS